MFVICSNRFLWSGRHRWNLSPRISMICINLYIFQNHCLLNLLYTTESSMLWNWICHIWYTSDFIFINLWSEVLSVPSRTIYLDVIRVGVLANKKQTCHCGCGKLQVSKQWLNHEAFHMYFNITYTLCSTTSLRNCMNGRCGHTVKQL